MFNPKYTISPKILSNIKHITELIVRLNGRHFSGVVFLELEKRARALSAHSSTSIEGNPLPLTEVKRLLKNAPENLRDSEKEVLNYNNALMYLKDNNEFNLGNILKIQELVTLGLINKFNSGKLRKEPVFVNDPKEGKTIYFPPDHGDVSRLMNELIEYVNNNKGMIDPLILAGIFHKQFVIIHPFLDGNGRTSRLSTKILLSDMGLNTFNLFSFENYYNNNVTKYFNEVGLVGDYYDFEGEVDFTPWIEYFTDGIIDELFRVGEEMNDAKSGVLESYEEKILDYIKKHGFIRDKDYALLVKRAKPTRHLDFKKLRALNLIEMQGKGKNSFYILKNKI